MTIQQQIQKWACPETAAFFPVAQAAAFRDYSFDNIGRLVETWICMSVIKDGIRLLTVGEGEAELYAHTDLSGIVPKKWRQSYPVIFVQLPNYDRLLTVAAVPIIYRCNGGEVDPGMAIHIAARVPPSKPAEDDIDFVHIFSDAEVAITTNVDGGAQIQIPEFASRAALCAVMRLSNYPGLYTHYGARAGRVLIRQRQRKGPPKRRELIPQIIRLKDPELPAQQQIEPGHRPDRTEHNRPHWRRGFWRNQACGPALSDHRSIWIRPVLVNQQFIEGGRAGMSLFERAV